MGEASCKSIIGLHIAAHALIVLVIRAVVAQLESGFTRANGCRHVAILARENRNITGTSRCFIPTKTTELNKFSLRDTVDPEWRWVLNHNGTVSAQIIVYKNNVVKMYSQKACLDPGEAIGRVSRYVYDRVGDNSHRIGIAANFNSPQRKGDAYDDCMSSTTQWYEMLFQEDGTDSSKNESLPSGTQQWIRKHAGEHEGRGDNMVQFNFSYDSTDIEEAFMDSLALAKDNKSGNSRESSDGIKSGRPIVRSGYAYETSLSVLVVEPLNGKLLKNITLDVDVYAWNRLLESESELAGYQDPPSELPSALTSSQVLSVTVLSLIAVGLYFKLMYDVIQGRRRTIAEWPQKAREDKWMLIYTAEEHKETARIPLLGFWELFEMFVGLVSAVIALTTAIIEVHDSNLYLRTYVLITQGGLITYDASTTEYSDEPDNVFSGARFDAGHWFVAQLVRVGKDAEYTLAILFNALLCVLVVAGLSVYASTREHKLDRRWLRLVLAPFRFTPQAVLGGLAYIPYATKVPLIKSYKKTYEDIESRLLHQQSEADVNLHNVDYYSKLPGPLGMLDPDAKLLPSLPNNGDDDARTDSTPLSRDDITKAAAVLASDQFGRLTFPQAVALMSSPRLVRSSKRWQSAGILPTNDDLRQLAAVFYVNAVVLPDSYLGRTLPSDHVHDGPNPVRVDDENEWQGARYLKKSPFDDSRVAESRLCVLLGKPYRWEKAIAKGISDSSDPYPLFAEYYLENV